MSAAHPLHDAIAKIAFFAQGLRLWALELVAWWVGMFGDRAAKLDLRRQIRQLRRGVRIVLLLSVVARMRLPARGGAKVSRPFGAPQDCRYRHRRIRFTQLMTRGVKLKSLDDLKHALDHLDDIAARLLKRAPKRLVMGALVTCGVVHDLRDALCDSFCAAAPDTS